MGRKSESRRKGLDIGVKVAIWALVFSLVSLGIHGAGFVRQWLYSSYDLRVSSLSFTLGRIVDVDADFVTELEFANHGTEQVSVLDVTLRLPFEDGTTFHLVPGIPLGSLEEARTFSLDPGQKSVRAFSFDWSEVDATKMITRTSTDYRDVAARVIVSVVDEFGTEASIFIGGISIRVIRDTDLVQSVGFSPRIVSYSGEKQAGVSFRQTGLSEVIMGQQAP